MRFALVLALVSIALGARAAFADEPVVVQGLNSLEYSVNSDPDRVSTDPEEIFEDRLDADIRFRRFLVGFRYEAFLPPFQSGPDSLRQGSAQRYAEASFPFGGLRVGNFYEIFGRGLLFRAYEERAIGVDTNMDGVLLWGSAGPFDVKGMSGRMMEAQTNRRSAVLRGTDLGVDVGHGLKIGGSYLMESAENPDSVGVARIANPWHVEALGGRASYTHDYFDIYYEGGRINRLHRIPTSDWLQGRTYDDLRGSGHYAALNLFPFTGVAITGEYKYYEKFRFQPVGVTGTDYNNPPAVTRETSYALISRHPHEMLPNDEKGYQVEAVVTPPIEGSTVTLNRTESTKIDGAHWFDEWYAEWRQYFGEKYMVAVAYDYIDEDKTRTKNHTPIIELEYFPGGEWSARSEYQYQETTTTLGLNRTHFGLIEYHVNLDLAFSVVGEHTDACATSFSDDGSVCMGTRKDDFFYGQVDWFFQQDHHLTLTVGKRQEGYICVGGVCQKVPELQGVEFKIVSQF